MGRSIASPRACPKSCSYSGDNFGIFYLLHWHIVFACSDQPVGALFLEPLQSALQRIL